MSWSVVARKDFADARRSLALWALVGIVVVFMAWMAILYRYLPMLGPEGEQASATGLLVFLAAPAGLFISIGAIVIASRSIIAEREVGSAKLLLSLPHSRRDIVLGKVLGRTGVVVGLAVGFVATLAVLVALYDAVNLVDYAHFGLATGLFALAYVALMVGVSTGASATARATAYALSLLVLQEFLWDNVPLAALYITSGFPMPAPSATMPAWIVFLYLLPPSQELINVLTLVIPGAVSLDAVGIPAIDGSFYLSGWFSLFLLVL